MKFLIIHSFPVVNLLKCWTGVKIINTLKESTILKFLSNSPVEELWLLQIKTIIKSDLGYSVKKSEAHLVDISKQKNS